MGRGTSEYGLGEAIPEELRRQLAEQAREHEAARPELPIELVPDQADKLKVTPLPEATPIELNTVELGEGDERGRVSQSQEYTVLLEQYRAREFDLPELERSVRDTASLSDAYSVAARALLADLRRQEQLPPARRGQPVERSLAEPTSRAESRREVRPIDQSPGFQFLSQLYIQGMEPWQMREEFLGSRSERERLARRYGGGPGVRELIGRQDWPRTVKVFLNHLQQGFDPAARQLAEIVLAQPELKDVSELDARDRGAADQRFVEVTRRVWQDFVYSGKWRYDENKKEYVVGAEPDLDARVSLFLFKLAKIDGALNAEPVAVGEIKRAATTLDSGKRWGVSVAPDGTVVVDNHQPWRSFETSTSQQLYRMLRSVGLVRETGPLRAMVELTVADDNAQLIASREQLEHSDRTLRGLHRFFDEQKLMGFLHYLWQVEAAKLGPRELAGRGSKIYQRVLDHQLTDAEVKRWGLGVGVKNQRRTIDRAHELLLDVKPESKLYEQGRLVPTRLGRAVVNIEGMGDKRFLGGHDAVAADPRGFELYLSYDPAKASLLLNTTKPDVDLSVVLARFVARHPDFVPVRGALLIKPRNGQPLSFSLRELLADLCGRDFQPQGQIKDFLEHALPEQPGEKTSSADTAVRGT